MLYMGIAHKDATWNKHLMIPCALHLKYNVKINKIEIDAFLMDAPERKAKSYSIQVFVLKKI